MLQQRNKSGGLLFGLIAIVVSFALILLPLIVGNNIKMSGPAQLIVSGFGVVLFILGAVVLIVSRLYVRASADESFVRTGQGGQKPIIDGGALVVPVIHDITWVSHQTMKLEVERLGKNALITGDHLRADVVAEFYIKIPKDNVSVIAAAATLGARGTDPEVVKNLVFQKLENGLRAVAGTKQLMDLHANRKGFVEAVASDIAASLKANGFELEEATISKLDQTPLASIDATGNIFDAQGATVIENITSSQRVERTKLKTQADQEVKDQEVSTQKAILAREVELEREQAMAEQQKAEARAKATSIAVKAEEEGKREAELAAVARQKDVEVANINRQKAQDVAQQEREQAHRTAEIEKQKATEVAEADKLIAVEGRRQALATAEAARQAEEAKAETERQNVTTVTLLAEAERQKQKAVIDEQGTIDKEANRKRTAADVAAYEVEKQSEAQEAAAQKRALAVRTEAEAKRDAELAATAAEQAKAMIPVEVSRQEVIVAAERVLVERSGLAAKAEFMGISRELETTLAQIAAGKEVDIARAEAMGLALSKASMTLWGDPTTFRSMTDSFMKGHSYGKFVEGLGEGLPDEVEELGIEALRGLGSNLSAIIKRLAGISASEQLDVDEIMSLVKAHIKAKASTKAASGNGASAT